MFLDLSNYLGANEANNVKEDFPIVQGFDC